MKTGFWGPEALPCLGRQGGVNRNNDSYNTKGVIHIRRHYKAHSHHLEERNCESTVAFFQIKVHPLFDSNNGDYGQEKLFTKS